MATVKIDGASEVKKMFQDILGTGDGSADKALKVAVNQTAYHVRTRLTAEIPSVFDNPRPITKSAVRYMKKSETKNQPTAHVYINDHPPTNNLTPAHWLWANIHGGKRDLKGYEKRLQRNRLLPQGKMTRPGPDVKLNQYGNIPSGTLVKMLSQLQAFNEGGYTANATKKGSYSYWATEHGVFRRKVGTSGYPETMLVYIRQSRPYKKRFDFYGIGQREGAERLIVEARKSLDYALKYY